MSDIPAIRIEVTAHRAEIKICPACGAENRGEFPEGVTGAVQYGNGVKTRAAYFTHRHFVPVGRTARIFKDLVQHRISEAPVLKAGAELSACVQPATDEVKKQLRKAEHALCNAHHLREPQYIEKQYGQPRAADMAALLREIKKAADETRPDADSLPPGQIAEFEQRYDAAVNAGYEANPRPPPEPGAPKKKGRPEQTPPLNLPNRFRDFRPQVSAFMYDFRVPFDNNQAERDVRMMKVKQKVSGSFRTVEGAERFARIRGYLSTARKNTVNIFSAIRDAFAGNPFIPSTEA